MFSWAKKLNSIEFKKNKHFNRIFIGNHIGR